MHCASAWSRSSFTFSVSASLKVLGVDLVLYRLLGGRELLGALILTLGRLDGLVNGVGGATQQAGQARADHDTSQHRFSPWEKHKSD